MKETELRQIIREEIEKIRQYPPIPNILYHGQPPKYENGKRIEPVKFDKFDQSQKRFLDDKNVGFYFTPNKYEAKEYAEGGYVYICNVKLKNPYYYENRFAYNNTGLIKSPNFITKKDKRILEKNDYDGVVILNPMYKISEVIALYPNQIKIKKIIK